MAGPNRTTYALLGLLAQGPKSGYEIKRAVETTIGHFWKESFGHIYPVLSRLAAEGLAEPVAGEAEGRTERHRYQITPAGEEALRRWLSEPVEPSVTRNELALKLFFGQHVPVEVSRQHLAEYRAYHERALALYRTKQPELEQRIAAGDQGATYGLLTLMLGIDYCQATIGWCASAEQRLAAIG
jgi:PadR family transcriptional regulator AphA